MQEPAEERLLPALAKALVQRPPDQLAWAAPALKRVVSPIEHLQGGRIPFLEKCEHNHVLCVYMTSLHSGENRV